MNLTVFKQVNVPKLSKTTLLFGDPEEVHIDEANTSTEFMFTSQSIFGILMWFAKGYRETSWSLYVLKALDPGQEGQLIDFVSSEVEVLFESHGQKAVRKAKKLLRIMRKDRPLTEYVDEEFMLANLKLRNL